MLIVASTMSNGAAGIRQYLRIMKLSLLLSRAKTNVYFIDVMKCRVEEAILMIQENKFMRIEGEVS